jgi:antitoxin component YwqK of YwqJK toxin-antitoxin module
MGSSHGSSPDKPMLDGKTFTGTLTSKADGKTYDESIIFENGMMRSTACEVLGFKAGPYTATKKDGKMTVKGSLKNDKGESSEIEATVEGTTLTGALTARKADGSVADTMTLKATKASKKASGEHPGKTEHPHSEHPR